MTLDFDSVRKSFGRLVALNDATFSLSPGTVVGLIGPNGSGKSTTLKLLSGALLPDSGTIHIPKKFMRMGVQTETFTVPIRTTGAGWLAFQRQLEGSTQSAIESDIKRRLGMSDHLNKGVRGYSKGMLKKLGILAAFTGTPPVVLLDEPFEGLDPIDRHEFMLLIRDYVALGNLVVISSHLLYELDDACDRILILKRGVLIHDLGSDRDRQNLNSFYLDLFRETR